ncbi:putative phosphatase SPAC5H10.03 [Cladobotryum mycophilum]|uniref:Phosphatase SPAC5H10.03 n=1 Tax=Cladobotryum mycophilum TaxID=491253 RepID=A0ABR0ST42_9HYPO
MPPTIVLIRHAQGLHNVDNNSPQAYEIRDPPLTDLGMQQCAELRKSLLERFSSVQNVAIISSPMRRTLQTALLSVDWLTDRGVRIEADADWQENSDKPCDTGSPIPSLELDFPASIVDFAAAGLVWPDKTSPSAETYACTRGSVLRRGRRCLEKLHRRPEELIFVFSHSGFLRLGVTGWWFFNSDYRIFRFDDDGNRDAWRHLVGEERVRPGLQQHEDTITGGLGLSWTHRVQLGSDLPDDRDSPASPNQQ